MIKEPIMINDVDVSGCECYNPNIKMDCILYPLQPDACKNNPNCHYKQLKAKEQECEEWKHQAELGSDTTDILTKQLEEKEQELDECREKFHKQLDQLKAANEELQEKIKAYDEVYSNHDVLNERNNYKQALQKIKEIIIEFSKQDILTFPDRKPEENYKFIQVQFREPIIQILQKCEVIDG